MADTRNYIFIRNMIRAAHNARISADRGKRTATTAKEKLDQRTEKDDQSISEQMSEQASNYASKAQETVRRATQRVKHTKQTAQRAKVVKSFARKRATAVAHSASKAAAEARATIALLSGGGILSLFLVTIVVLFGCGIALFGGNNGNTYTPVSDEVEAYDLTIRQYANQYGISEYVELIKAVMMQESGGRGSDPMQASECGFNIRFPRRPNGITDPVYSIQVGVQELAACLRLAKVETPVDMEHIRLALQGYNYGEGYITWAQLHYGGYSAINAMEYSSMMAERNHWNSYGDHNYVNHVLQYYPLGHVFLPGSGQALVEVARSQIGNVGGEPYWSWYGFQERVEWCACFVSWCADQCGYIDKGIIPKYSYCPTGVDWFKECGHWVDRDGTPEPGMIIFFDWASREGPDGEADHTGIVEKVENGRVYAIEGNSSNACREKSYPIGWFEIFGYGKPLT